MPHFLVARDRAYWVREVMHIDAATEEEAENQFYETFDPELEIVGPFRFGNATHETPLEVTACEPPSPPAAESA
jgi:hypothetical protein